MPKQNQKPGVAYVATLNLPLAQNKLPDYSAQPWWLDCEQASIQVIPPDPTNPDSYAVVAIEELGAAPGNDSTRLASTSDRPFLLNSQSEILNFRAILQIGISAKLRVKFYSTYF